MCNVYLFNYISICLCIYVYIHSFICKLMSIFIIIACILVYFSKKKILQNMDTLYGWERTCFIFFSFRLLYMLTSQNVVCIVLHVIHSEN
jgi:hypothetical protein